MIFIFVSLLLFFSPLVAQWPYIPFDIAMKKDAFPNVYVVTERIMDINGIALYNFFDELYEQNCTLAAQPDLLIPKIIHQIWLGSPLPEEFEMLQQTWIQYHMDRGWVYKLWTDEDVAQLGLYNQEFYDDTDNYGVKSDIVRWELLYRFGGVYVDMDYECLSALDELHYTYDFYTALQPLDTTFVQLGAALVGSRPGHPILEHCINTIKDDWHHKGAPKKTGPVHFTKSFYAWADKNGNKDIAFPAFYFYPLGCRDTVDNRALWKQQGAFAVHWWAKSWMPKEYRPSYFKNINNDDSAKSWND
jgi:inositol phosphorylceramide mannosyltransferase catalytic subunit